MRALRSPGLLGRSPSERTGVSRRPTARNDDRGSTQMQLALALGLRASHAAQQDGQLGLTVRAGFGEYRLEMRARRLGRDAKKAGDLRELSTARDGLRQPDLGGR